MLVEKFVSSHDPFILGVVSDTHVPDRVNGLHPQLLSELAARQVDLILHGGDISRRSILAELEKVASVRAVTGNRDLLLAGQIPMSRSLNINGTILTLTHGHLDPWTYWMEKFAYVTRGYQFERYQNLLARSFPESKGIVFGHTHHPESRWVNGQLFFNPGSVSHGDYLDRTPVFGLLHIYNDGRIETEFIRLSGAIIQAKRWVKG